MTPRGDLDIVKAGLIDRIEEVCAKLLPDGKAEGPLWVSFNPVENDYGKTPALKVRIRRGDPGAWRCWRSGDKGDALGLVAYLLRTDIKGALAWGRDFLGLKSMSREEREQLRAVEGKRKVERQAKDEKARAEKLRRAGELFRSGGQRFPLGGGTPPERHARAYFAARGVPLDQVENINRESFMFSPASEWWTGAVWKNEDGRRWKDAPGPFFPAVHAAMRAWNGQLTACHVTFLDPLKPKKAPVEPAKLMFGEALGAAIEISMGPSAKPFWMTEEAHPLVVAEGIETALSFAIAAPEARVWACGSLAGIGGAPVDLPCVAWILFARDNNAGNPQAQKQFSAALEKLEASGKRVVVEASHVGDDFNDLAQGEE